jgi:hypothetical protein
MEVRQALFGQHVERERGADGVRDALRLIAEVRWNSRAAFRLRRHEVGRHPDLPLPLVALHELAHRFFEVPQHIDLQGKFLRRIRGDAHAFPFVAEPLGGRQNDQPPKIQ